MPLFWQLCERKSVNWPNKRVHFCQCFISYRAALTARLSAPPPSVGFSSLPEAIRSNGGLRVVVPPDGAAAEALHFSEPGEPEDEAARASQDVAKPKSLAEAVSMVEKDQSLALYADIYFVAAL